MGASNTKGKNNRLIAKFMQHGAEYILVDADKYRGEHVLSCYPVSKEDCEYDLIHFEERYSIDRDSMEIREVELKYHSSWDWLIPVLKKISETLYSDFAGVVRDQWQMIDTPTKYPMEDVYTQAVEFIKWYNNQ